MAGSGETLGTIRLIGFGDLHQETQVEAEMHQAGVRLYREELEQLRQLLTELRDLLGYSFSRRGRQVEIAVTDGGLASYHDPLDGGSSLPYDLLRRQARRTGDRARLLVLEEALINLAHGLLGDAYCGVLQLPPRAEGWGILHSYRQAIVVLGGLQRFLHLGVERQVELCRAFRRLQLPGGHHIYTTLLEELRGSSRYDLPADHVGRALALVTLTPELLPREVDSGLMEALTRRFLDTGEGDETDPGLVGRWIVSEHERSREFNRVVWQEHIRLATSFGRALQGIDLRRNRPADALDRLASRAVFPWLHQVRLDLEEARTLEEAAAPLERGFLQLQADIALGVENIRSCVQLLCSHLAERHGVSRFSGDRLRFLHTLTQILMGRGRGVAAGMTRACAQRLEREQRELQRRRARLEKAASRSQQHSRQARTLFLTKVRAAGENLPVLLRVVQESLVRQPSLTVSDARGAIDDLLAHLEGRPDVAQPLMEQIEDAITDPLATPVIQEALHRRHALLHAREVSYEENSTTELFEILCSTLTFEGSIQEVEDRGSKEEIRRCARAALHREKGILRGLVLHRRQPLGAALWESAAAPRITQALNDLRRKSERGRGRALGELIDSHFRLGLWAALHDQVPDAVSHLRELVRLTLDDELLAQLAPLWRETTQTPSAFKETNRALRSREMELRRARAAGQYLELVARQAERELQSGLRPRLGHEHLEKVLDTLELGRVLGERQPVYQILRSLPVVVILEGVEYRIRDLLRAGEGGQVGQMALFRHLLANHAFSQFMGYRLVETARKDGRIGRFVGKLQITGQVLEAYLRVFPAIFPGFESEMIRQRLAVPSQLFTIHLVDELCDYLQATGAPDAQLLRPLRARLLRIKEQGHEFSLFLLEHVANLEVGLPKTVFQARARPDGMLAHDPAAVVALEHALSSVRMALARRLGHATRSTRSQADQVDGQLALLRAHSACLALLMMNVDHQVFTAEGRLVPMDYEILFAPCLDPAWSLPGRDPEQPVSTHCTRRINVAWVSETDDLLPYLETATRYQSFIAKVGDQIAGWAEHAGFEPQDADRIERLIRRNASRLMPDLRTLVQCGGTVYLSGNSARSATRIEFGSVLPCTPA